MYETTRYEDPEGNKPRVLFVCSAGMLRSPTAMDWAIKTKGWNARAVGAFKEYAICPVTSTVVMWAERIFCMENEHTEKLLELFKGLHLKKKITTLGIPDDFSRDDPVLLKLIEEKIK